MPFGFVFVSAQETGPMKDATAGARILCRNDIYQSIQSLRIYNWPGKIWQVQILDVVDAAVDHRYRQQNQKPHSVNGLSIVIVDEIPPAHLFGRHTDAVCSIIERTSQLDTASVEALAKAQHPLARDAYSRALDNWRATERVLADGHNEGTSSDGSRSPINEGFRVIDFEIRRRAQDSAGDTAFILVEYDIDIEVPELEPTWSAARDSLFHAAMAFGAPELMNTEDQHILSSAWIAVFGKAP